MMESLMFLALKDDFNNGSRGIEGQCDGEYEQLVKFIQKSFFSSVFRTDIADLVVMVTVEPNESTLLLCVPANSHSV